MSEVVNDSRMAARIMLALCQDLERPEVVDHDVLSFLELLELLISYCPFVVHSVAHPANAIRSIHHACQRQLCSGEEERLDFQILEAAFLAIEYATI